jgi:hypothetical protein
MYQECLGRQRPEDLPEAATVAVTVHHQRHASSYAGLVQNAQSANNGDTATSRGHL